MLLHAEYDSWIWLVLSVLAVWRITTLICRDAGPFDILVAFRRLVYRLRLKSLVDCFDCAAVWVSIVTVLLIYRPRWISVVLVAAIAGAASIIERLACGATDDDTVEGEEA